MGAISQTKNMQRFRFTCQECIVGDFIPIFIKSRAETLEFDMNTVFTAYLIIHANDIAYAFHWLGHRIIWYPQNMLNKNISQMINHFCSNTNKRVGKYNYAIKRLTKSILDLVKRFIV